MSAYAVVKVDRATGAVIAVAGRGLAWHHADRLAGELTQSAQDGHYFTARNERDVDAAMPGR